MRWKSSIFDDLEVHWQPVRYIRASDSFLAYDIATKPTTYFVQICGDKSRKDQRRALAVQARAMRRLEDQARVF